MKAILASVVVAVSVCATAASAADLIVEAPATVATSSIDWNGFYAGVVGGYASGNIALTSPSIGADNDVSGAVAGIEAGYNRQNGALLLGVETDLLWAGIDSEQTTNSFYNITFGVDWVGTATVRAGAALDSVLLYAEAGLAYGQASITGEVFNTPPMPNIPYDNSDWAAGWTVGAGIELALSNSLSAKFEYNYVDIAGFVSDIPTGGDHEYATQLHIAKVGLNYGF